MTQAPEPAGTKCEDIAIIGIAARLPGARTVDEFWANIRDGVESIRRLTDEELLAAGVSRAELDDPDYVKACPVLADVDKFDAAFFGLSARDASVMDPAHRIFLEVAWQAFEHAGYTALPQEGPVGVFAAAGAPLYMMENLRTNPDLMRSVGDFLVRHTGNDMNFLATRVSYEMDLRGPSMNVQTACSSSLVSVHMACQSLSRGECTLALAGGSTILFPKDQGYHFKEGEILSPDGHCRPFDAKSAGTVFGSGAGAVILKRLSDALDDGDTIHAVIKGSAINNDGAMKVSYLAPGVEGQAAVVASALNAAGVTADSISYIETHGTGTLVGDPIEVEALNEAFRSRTNRRGYCAIGSVKSNIGHLGEAAGSAALIKAIMALKHRQLPPSLGFETPNPAIDFDDSPFFVNASLRDWTGEGPLRCGVTALGAGGTNCHLILEEAPPALPGEGARDQQLLVLSAKTRTALDLACENLARELEANADSDLADVAYTLAVGRRDMPHRRIIAAGSNQDAVHLLRTREPRHTATGVADEAPHRVVFMFPGGGAQYAGMGAELYAQEDVYRDAIDECLKDINPVIGRDLRDLMFPQPDEVETATRTLEQPSLTLPTLFATEYAMARLFQSWGVKPQAYIGHSMGEYVAACLAGVMKLEDAIRLVMLRGRLFEVVQRGGMLSVPLSESELRSVMPADLDIAAVNAPELSVASGPAASIRNLEVMLTEREIDSTAIRIDVAAHSAMLEPVLEQFRELCRTIPFKAPETPFVSNVTGTWITAEQATSPDYWVSHLRSTVRFADGLETLRELGEPILLEVGPGRTLSMLARAQTQPMKNAFNCMRHPQEQASDLNYALVSLGRLWTVGAKVDWAAFHDGQLRNRVPLPTYPFEGKSYWVEPGKAVATAQSQDLVKRTDLANWFYGMNYAEAPLVVQPSSRSRIWLLLCDDAREARQLARALGPEKIIIGCHGRKFAEQLDGTWRLDLDNPAHLASMMQQMEEHVGVPDHVVLLNRRDAGRQQTDEGIRQYFFRPVHVLQAMAGWSSSVQFSIVTSGIGGVGAEHADPIRSLTLGPALVGSREFDHIHIRCIDVPAERQSCGERSRVVTRLARELLAEPTDTIVALQASGRWIRRALPMPLPAFEESSDPASWVREGGVYLITGGLGGIGLEVSERLARAKPVKLALLVRESLPPEAQWPDLLASHPDGRVAQRISRINTLRALGAEVMIVIADVANAAQVSAAVAQVRESFGPLNGVIHGAGVMDDAPMMTKTAEAMNRVLAPKVAGTMALDNAIRDNLDFFILFSSVASYLGLPGQVDYTAANAFQDAFARARSARASGRTVVINWNAWRDVGMAASAHQVQTSGLKPEHPSVHPAFDGYADTRAGRTFVASFRGEAAWLLDEHVVKDGPSVLPGTAFVELARAAFAETAPYDAIELCDLVFGAPFTAKEGAAQRLSIEVTRTGQSHAIAMRDGPDQLQPAIVTGEARAFTGPRPASLDLAAIDARCTQRRWSNQTGCLEQDFMAFGPRWANIRRTSLGGSEALIELSLDEAFESDLGKYVLHPALFDMATGGAQALVPDIDLHADFYVPLGYGRVRIFGALPRQVFSHVRCLPETGNGLAYFDISVCDRDGRVLVEVSRFTMRRIDREASFAAASTTRAPKPVRNNAMEATLREAISPREGLEALDRIMAQPCLVQVIASSVDVNIWQSQIQSERSEAAADDAVVGDASQRPDNAPEYVAPATVNERTLAKIWSDLLGFSPVGTLDNFFDMGGNSLQGVRLFAAIRKKFSVSLPLATLFEAQTIADLAKLLSDSDEEDVPTEKGWSPMVRLKPGAPGRTPIFFIHGSRGNVLVFKGFADKCDPGQPCYALQALGVDGAAQPDQCIEAMARRYMEAIRKVQPHGPYMLAGYSGGGVIAYEINRRLKLENEKVDLLMLIDTLEPGAMRTPITLLDRVLNLHRLKSHRFAEYPQLVWKYRMRPWIRRKMGVQEIAAPRTLLEKASDAVDAAYRRAQFAYHTSPLETDVVIIRALDADVSFLRAGPELGWKPYVQGKIRIFDVDTDHDRVFEEPSLSKVVAAFDQVLAEAT